MQMTYFSSSAFDAMLEKDDHYMCQKLTQYYIQPKQVKTIVFQCTLSPQVLTIRDPRHGRAASL